MDLNGRLISGLYGSCVADAVGNPFEFKGNINPVDVIKYANDTNLLEISDDSQMNLFGFEVASCIGTPTEKNIKSQFTRSYLDWYYTQTHKFKNNVFIDGLLSFESMYDVQAPGTTCLHSLYKILNGYEVKNSSMGCGSVMRLLPLVSLFDKCDYEDAIKFAQITGNITHKHKMNDVAIRKYMDTAYKIINDVPLDNTNSDVKHISELGEGWIAPECVNMAIWAYSKAITFDDLLMLSISHSGDSDSVATVAGSLWGLSGKEVPEKYIKKLNALDAIEYTINDCIGLL